MVEISGYLCREINRHNGGSGEGERLLLHLVSWMAT